MRFIWDTLVIFWHAIFPARSQNPWTVMLETGTRKTFDTPEEAERFADHRCIYSTGKLMKSTIFNERLITLSHR